jgi:hypothetical protein
MTTDNCILFTKFIMPSPVSFAASARNNK